MSTTKRTQNRGRLRRASLVEACRALLRREDIRNISLTTIAECAGIPKSSAYYFFSDAEELFQLAAADMHEELLAYINLFDDSGCSDWPCIVGKFNSFGAQFFNEHRDAAQLLAGPFASSGIKLRVRMETDVLIGNRLGDLIRDRFILPAIETLPSVFFNAVEISDLFFHLSLMKEGMISEAYEREATRAACAYIGLYLPPILPLRHEAEGQP